MSDNSSENSGNNEASASVLGPSERISELNDVDHSVSTLLSSASEAIAILSNTSHPSRSNPASSSLAASQAAFSAAASTYFSTLSSIEVRLRRQVYALEEAGLIPPGDERDARRGRVLGQDSGIVRTGGGPLDSSWLNARAHDRVGDGMKEEIRAQLKAFVEKIDVQENSNDPDAGTLADHEGMQ